MMARALIAWLLLTPALAVAAEPAAAVSSFPALPPALPCKPPQIVAIWRLKNIYEEPPGAWTEAFAAEPFHYLHFDKDTTYKLVRSVKQVNGWQPFLEQFKRSETDQAQQFVAHESGFIYFYNAGAVTETQACFIVASDFGSFKKGQMLLMPPAPAAGQKLGVRLLKVYEKVIPPKPRRRRR